MWNQRDMIKRGALYDNLEHRWTSKTFMPAVYESARLPWSEMTTFLTRAKFCKIWKRRNISQIGRIYRLIFMILATLGNILYICRRLILVCSILLRITSQKKTSFLFWRHNSGGFFHFLRLHCLQVTLTPPGLASSLPLATTCMAKKEAPKDPPEKMMIRPGNYEQFKKKKLFLFTGLKWGWKTTQLLRGL